MNVSEARECASQTLEKAGHGLMDAGLALGRIGAYFGLEADSLPLELGPPGALKGLGHVLVMFADIVQPETNPPSNLNL